MPEGLCEALAFQTVQRLRRLTGRLAGVAGRAEPLDVAMIEGADAVGRAIPSRDHMIGFAVHPNEGMAMLAPEACPEGDELAHRLPVGTGDDFG